MTEGPTTADIDEPLDSPAALAADPMLGHVVERHGPVTIEPADDLFERLVVSLVRQQVSMDAAAAIRERLFDAVEVTPAGILEADDERLTEAGLSGAKVEYVNATARAFQERGYDHAYFAGMADEAVVAELSEVRGIGPWTTKMFLMFGLGREDVFPVEDLGIRKAMAQLFDEELSRGAMRDEARAWRPYRSYASRYLWQLVEA